MGLKSTPSAVRVARIRKALQLKQTDFGTLLGVHPMTVSKWERAELQPTPYQHALMSEFERAAGADEVKETLRTILVGAGIAAALYLLLKHAQK